MAQASNVIHFPVIPRNTPAMRLEPPIEASNNEFVIRLFLKNIIDIAYDGLLNDREAEALDRIVVLFPLERKSAH